MCTSSGLHYSAVLSIPQFCVYPGMCSVDQFPSVLSSSFPSHSGHVLRRPISPKLSILRFKTKASASRFGSGIYCIRDSTSTSIFWWKVINPSCVTPHEPWSGGMRLGKPSYVQGEPRKYHIREHMVSRRIPSFRRYPHKRSRSCPTLRFRRVLSMTSFLSRLVTEPIRSC